MTARHWLAALITGAILCVALAITYAHAEVQCGKWETMRDKLASQYGEKPAWIATTNGGVITFTVNPTSGSWTMLLQPSADIACVVASGQGWEAAPPSLSPPAPVLPQFYPLPTMGWPRFVLPARG